MRSGESLNLPHLPAPTPSPEKVRRQQRRYADQIFDDWSTLHEIIQRHEALIQKRWTKKSKQQRQKILLEAWPNMAAQHRPDLEAFRRAMRADEYKFSDAYMWPYINLEDLSKTRPMLLFLHSRGHGLPHDFVYSDLDEAMFGELVGIIVPAELEGYRMVFHNRNEADNYGGLYSSDDKISGPSLAPGQGLQVLKTQRRIWRFLVDFCEILLKDKAPLTEGPIEPSAPPQPAHELKTRSLEMMSMEAPYCVPAAMDIGFARLRVMASAERNAFEDHLWDLREDPSYFSEIMQDYAEHQIYMIPDTRGREHPWLRQPGRPAFWTKVFKDVVVEAYWGFAHFNLVLSQIEKLELEYKSLTEAQSQNTDRIDVESVADAFLNLRYTLERTRDACADELKFGFTCSPPMRCYSKRLPPTPGSKDIRTKADMPESPNHPVNKILPLLQALYIKEHMLHPGFHIATDEIGHLMSTDPEVKALISPWVGRKLSTISVLAECLHQLESFQPLSGLVEAVMRLDEDESKSKMLMNYTDAFGDWIPLLDTEFDNTQIYRLADPSDGKFAYPVNRRRNKANVEAMRQAEANLDAFWSAVDTHYKTKAVQGRCTCCAHPVGSTHIDLMSALLNSDRTLQRTPEWVEPETSEKPATEKVEYEYQPFSSVFHDPMTQVTGTFYRTSLSDNPAPSKTKTGGIATTSTETTQQQPSIPHTPTQPERVYQVDKRSHKVFKALFHSPDNPDLPGEIPWQDFLHSMTFMGFSAEKLHGSAWNFAPKVDLGVGLERSIQFHEPHPGNKLPFLWARRIGRRLARAYGWTGQRFRLG